MAPPRHARRQAPGWFRTLFILGSALQIFALGLFAVSPSLHEQLHHHADSPQADGCAIVLFAGGVSLPLDVTAEPPRSSEWREQPSVAAREVFVDSPRYLHRPERGPPVA